MYNYGTFSKGVSLFHERRTQKVCRRGIRHNQSCREEHRRKIAGFGRRKKVCAYMGDKLREIGIEPFAKSLRFPRVRPIGGIPYAGWLGLALSALVYIAMGIPAVWYGMALASAACIVWLVCSVFLYKTWFDMFFKQEVSQNTYGELSRRTASMTTPSSSPAIPTPAGTGVIPSTLRSSLRQTPHSPRCHLRQGRLRRSLLLLPCRHFDCRRDPLHRLLFRRKLGQQKLSLLPRS